MSKYIIDVGDAYTKHICGEGDMLCLPVRINEFKDNWMNTNIPLTPYTKPDMEKVRKEEYEKGLGDAWEVALKIFGSPSKGALTIDEMKAIFGNTESICNYTAAEAIEKLKAYEQEQQIQVGDEVAFHHDDGRPDTVVVVTYIGQDGFIDGMDGRGTQYAHKNPKKWTKTGRDFPEIAEALRKMKGE